MPTARTSMWDRVFESSVPRSQMTELPDTDAVVPGEASTDLATRGASNVTVTWPFRMFDTPTLTALISTPKSSPDRTELGASTLSVASEPPEPVTSFSSSSHPTEKPSRSTAIASGQEILSNFIIDPTSGCPKSNQGAIPAYGWRRDTPSSTLARPRAAGDAAPRRLPCRPLGLARAAASAPAGGRPRPAPPGEHRCRG